MNTMTRHITSCGECIALPIQLNVLSKMDEEEKKKKQKNLKE